ncbi:MAG TPA: hypothetical protein VHG08_27810 [Longimicrobium sp.]|nr:hypothetical protein [Longimicrobium sp.]
MRKLRLEMGELQVESFATGSEMEVRRGTVEAYKRRAVSSPTACGGTCVEQTCAPTLGDTYCGTCEEDGCVADPKTMEGCPTEDEVP